MKKQLYPHQKKLLRDLINGWKDYRSLCAVAPTGFGKSVVISHLVKQTINRGKRVLLFAHRKELIEQLHSHLANEGVTAGIIMGGHPRTYLPVQVASVQTLINRELPPADLIIHDECHHLSLNNSFSTIWHSYPKALKVGFTATPARLDGKPLGDHIDKLILGPTTKELMDLGFLVPFDLYACKSPLSDKSIKTRMKAGDYDQRQILEQIDLNVLNGSLVREYQEKAFGKKIGVFASNVEHGSQIAEAYNRAGILARFVSGRTPKKEREKIFSEFRKNKFKILVNVSIVSEGIDIPDIDGVQWARKTASLVFWWQGIGRALRCAPGKEKAIVLDHTDNWRNPDLPWPTSEIEWSLEGKVSAGKPKQLLQDEEGLIIEAEPRPQKEIEYDESQTLQLVNQEELLAAYGITSPDEQKQIYDRHYQHAINKGYKIGYAYHKTKSECRAELAPETQQHINTRVREYHQ